MDEGLGSLPYYHPPCLRYQINSRSFHFLLFPLFSLAALCFLKVKKTLFFFNLSMIKENPIKSLLLLPKHCIANPGTGMQKGKVYK